MSHVTVLVSLGKDAPSGTTPCCSIIKVPVIIEAEEFGPLLLTLSINIPLGAKRSPILCETECMWSNYRAFCHNIPNVIVLITDSFVLTCFP